MIGSKYHRWSMAMIGAAAGCVGLACVSGCGGGGASAPAVAPTPAVFMVTGAAVDAITSQPLAVRVTVLGLPGSPFSFPNGQISIPNVPASGSPYSMTIEALSSSLAYPAVVVQVTQATASIPASQLQLFGAPLPPPNPLP